MSAILTTLGLSALPGDQAPNHVVACLLANWLISFGAFSNRREKMKLGLDHNQAPREDLARYGEVAVQSGKISRQTLDRLKRQEAIMANSAEHYPLFVAAILVALHTGVPHVTINRIGLWYGVSRLAFGFCYKYNENLKLSFLRSAFWWSGSICCFTAFWLAAKSPNAGLNLPWELSMGDTDSLFFLVNYDADLLIAARTQKLIRELL